MPSYALIVNPASGRGLAARRAAELARALPDGTEVEVLETSARGDATRLAAAAAPRVDRIVAVGGDGTLNEVVGGLVSAGLPSTELPELAFLPAGTANAATRAFRLDSDPRVVARTLRACGTKPLDVGLVRHGAGERAFVLWCGAGMDAVVIHAMHATRTGHMGIRGLVRRGPGLVRAMLRYPQGPIEAEVDGVTLGTYGTVVVANVGEISFSGRVAEGADPGDGRLDVVAVPPSSRTTTVRLAWRMATSSLSRAPEVRHTTGREIELRGDETVPLQIDGEPAGSLPATVRVVPGLLRLLTT